jgi:hypothetical protein
LPQSKGFVPHVCFFSLILFAPVSSWIILLLTRHCYLQVIALTKSPLISERVGDSVIIGKSSEWQIKINSRLGTIDSWKVCCGRLKRKFHLLYHFG